MEEQLHEANDRVVEADRAVTPKSRNNRSRGKLLSYRPSVNYLTDPHTSDNTTNKSNETASSIKIHLLEEKVKKLSKENSELKDLIIEIKANQFYTVNEQKVKQAVHDNEQLRKQNDHLRSEIDRLKIENQFLEQNYQYVKDGLRKSIRANSKGKVLSTSRKQNTQIKYENVLEDFQQCDENQITPIKKPTKKTIHQVKSNPNLLSTNEEEGSGKSLEEQKPHRIAKAPKQILKNTCQSGQEAIRYRQAFKQNYDFNDNHMPRDRHDQLKQPFLIPSPRNTHNASNKNIRSSKSRQITLHSILAQKRQMMSGNKRPPQSPSAGNIGNGYQQTRSRHELNLKPNSPKNFNQDYFIGKNTGKIDFSIQSSSQEINNIKKSKSKSRRHF